MNVAIIASNYARIDNQVKRGPEIFVYELVKHLSERNNKDINLTAFASGDSKLPVPIISIHPLSSLEDPSIGTNNATLFELALISKAISQKNQFDLYHINIGVGETVLPFTSFTNKPIIITLHHSLDSMHLNNYFSFFKNNHNVYFVSISNFQRAPQPNLNYIKTIYHGVDLNIYNFKDQSDDYILWTGRGAPEKGFTEVLEVAKKSQLKTKVFPIVKEKHKQWLYKNLEKVNNNIEAVYSISRNDLIHQYQNAKVFLFPIKWEEPFGLVMIESMACGTPVIAYARGSAPEIIEDGKTGFLVNPSSEDVRGDFLIKQTGLSGLEEAVKRIFSLSKNEYQIIRKNCREHVEKHFTVERMVDEYEKVYEEILNNTKK